MSLLPAEKTSPERRQRIMFVDDEEGVLEGLENVFRKHRREWDMVFLRGGEAALAEMVRSPADVVVSDMRMPGMDGAELLERVRDRYPQTARIVLSGHAEKEAMARALPVAHQLLAKPCEPALLREVIQRTCRLARILGDDSIRSVVGKLDKLPSPPVIYLQLTAAVADPKVPIQEIAEIVERDPAMSIKVLQIVNSPYFGLSRRMVSIQQGVTYLGLELLKGVALAAHVFSSFEPGSIEGFSLDRVQEHALMTARLGRRMTFDKKLGDEAFTAGLVHDIGKVILAVALPAEFSRIARRARETGERHYVIEREVLGVSHAELGAYLMGIWGLPFSIVEAIAHHHCPAAVSEGSRELLGIVHTADALVDSHLDSRRSLESLIDRPFLEDVGIFQHLPRWLELAREECHEE